MKGKSFYTTTRKETLYVDQNEMNRYKAIGFLYGVAFVILLIIIHGIFSQDKPDGKAIEHYSNSKVIQPKNSRKYVVSDLSLCKTLGRALNRYSHEEVIGYLKARKFKSVDRLKKHQAIRVALIYNYQPLFRFVAKHSNINEAVIYAFFIIEATAAGRESDLMANNFNPGGIKYRSHISSQKVKAKDDCGAVPCDFSSFNTAEEAALAWTKVFNAPRYQRCKKLPVEATCKCLQANGYHTARNYRVRTSIASNYWTLIKNHLPK